ncbi:MAG: hypothetical protein HYZ10_03055 [Ignavibacteriales bacterium]|nr:hypothetical protein [Ignavibacteriales bacterium]
MKSYRILFFLFASVLLVLLSNCVDNNFDMTTGTVKRIELEGGFWGIVSDDNVNFDPINLSQIYQVDGKRVKFSFKERKDLSSFHMWGTIIEIIEINELK